MSSHDPKKGIFLFCAVMVLPVLCGTCIKFLWEWFMVPFGIVPISIPWAIGLTALASLLRPDSQSKRFEESDLRELPYEIFKILFITCVGFIAHLCM